MRVLTPDQKFYKDFEEAIGRDDVQKNDKGEIAVHGNTFSAWTTKVPDYS